MEGFIRTAAIECAAEGVTAEIVVPEVGSEFA